MWLVNPAVVVPNWNDSNKAITLEVHGATLTEGTDFRLGFEQTTSGMDLVIWLHKTIDLVAADDHFVEVSIQPVVR